MDVIKPAETKRMSPIVLLSKNDSALCFSVDYQKLNAVPVQNSYPILGMKESIDSLREATIFSTMDANGACWKVEIAEHEYDKKAFTSHHGYLLYTKATWAEKRPREVATLDGHPTY